MVHESLIKEVNIPELVEALRDECDWTDVSDCIRYELLMQDAAAAIEELEKERDYYKQQYENRQRLIKCALGEEWT